MTGRTNLSERFVWMPSLKVWILSPFQYSSKDGESKLETPDKSRNIERFKRKNFEISPDSINSPCGGPEKRFKSDGIHQDLSFGCPICLVNFKECELAVLRLCMHKFCDKCIEKWSNLQRKCPLCKREFDGWFYDIQGSKKYKEKLLLPLAAVGKPSIDSNCQQHGRIERREPNTQSSLNSARSQILGNQPRSRPLPRRRHFGQSRFVSVAEKRRSEETSAAQKAIRWRASIYRRGRRAIPPCLQGRSNIRQNFTGDSNEKARIERRLEPWIRREMEAILGDQDPSLLVHLVLSLWFSYLREQEQKQNWKLMDNKDQFVQQLEPFLGDNAFAFWHELRCFAESPFTMSAYDSVVDYQRSCLDRSGDVR
eukprot:Gb_19948 [translate_table: standard]